jgi:hypothetical protein
VAQVLERLLSKHEAKNLIPVPRKIENLFNIGVNYKDLSNLPSVKISNQAEVIFCLCFFIYFAVLGLELKAYTLSHSTSPFFVMGFYEMGSHKLFAQAGFEL